MDDYIHYMIDGGDECFVKLSHDRTDNLPIRVMLFADDETSASDQWISEEAAAEIGKKLISLSEVSKRGEPQDVNPLGYVEGALSFAAAHGRQVKFSYETEEVSALQLRTLTPEEIITTKAGHKIVVGIDGDREDLRAFRLDRISGTVLVK